MAAQASAVPAAAPSLRIRLIGDLEVSGGGMAIALPASRRTRALLGYLVGTGNPHMRQTLCDLLWDGPDDPRAALRWSLTKLRGIVDAPEAARVLADRDKVAFAARGAVVDITRVHSLLDGGCERADVTALEEAVQLLNGEFLDGLDLPNCYRFHQWCMAERERYGRLRRAALGALIGRLHGEPEQALPHARAMLAIDPLSEAAHATVVQLIAACGRYTAAEAHYVHARELLRRELSLPPGGPLDAAIRSVRAHIKASPPAEPPSEGISVERLVQEPDAPLTTSLVGRVSEQEAIERLLGSASGHDDVLLFLGEPGMGKTRVLEHFAERASARGRRVVRGRCYQAEMVRPYGLWLDALRAVRIDTLPPEVAAAVAPLLEHGSAEALAPAGDRARLFDAAAALFRTLASGPGLAIVLDDLQWIDEGSAALLHFVARTRDPSVQIGIAAAARSGEIDDNRWAKGLVQSLAREQQLTRYSLLPLNADEACRLVGAAEFDAVLGEAGGNPLYLLELARAPERPALHPAQTLDALIDERLDALEHAEREALEWAAAMGRETRPELLAQATGIGVTELLARLQRLERRGLMKPTGEGHFDFAHDLVRRAVYRSLSQPRRRSLHRQLARALEAASTTDPRLHGELVHHASIAGDAVKMVTACLAAAQHCLRIFANAEAIAVTERGLAALAEIIPQSERVHLTIGLLAQRIIADTTRSAHRQPELAAALDQAIETARALGLEADAAEGLHMLGWLRQQANDTARAATTALEAERAGRKADAGTRCQVLANIGRCLLEVESELPRARDLVTEAGQLADALALKVIEFEWGQGLLARQDGDYDAAQAAVEKAVTLARLREDHWRNYECLAWLATITYEGGHFARTAIHCEELQQAALRMGDSDASFARTLGALARLQLGEAATSALRAGLDALRAADDKAHLAYTLNEAVEFELAAGRLDAAEALSQEALAAARAVNRATEIAVATASLARIAARTGDAPRARFLLDTLNEAGADGRLTARALNALARAEQEKVCSPTPAPT